MIPEVAGGVSEDRVSDAAFELVFAFDEVGLICVCMCTFFGSVLREGNPNKITNKYVAHAIHPTPHGRA